MDRSKERALLKYLLLRKLNFIRNQLEIVTGLFMGYRHLKGHVSKLGLVDGPECDICKQANEVASNVLCDCETLSTLRFRHMDQHFMKPGNLEEISVSRILHLSKSVVAKCMNVRAALKIK